MLAVLGGKWPSKVACHMNSVILHWPHEATLLLDWTNDSTDTI